MPDSTSSFSLTLICLFHTSMATNKPHAILRYIEVEGELGHQRKRSQYSVRLSLADNAVARSTHLERRSLVLKWEWNAKNQISFEPSSTMKVEVFKVCKVFNTLVGQYQGNVEDLLDNNASFVLTDKKGNPIALKMKIALSVVHPETRAQQANTGGNVVYEGLETIVEGLDDCSDLLLPLKTAAGEILKVVKFVETVLENKKELEYLKANLDAILSIVEQYQKHDILPASRGPIERFCQAITRQLKPIEDMRKHSSPVSAAQGTKDTHAILEAIGNINSLCDVFQMDTRLNIEGMIGDISQRLKSSEPSTDFIIEKLNHQTTSYKTRQSSYGDPTGCMQGTRIKVLEELDTWAANANSSRVYWMVGMAGIGKSTIAHTFCEILEAKNVLGGSFFASRVSERTRNARLIIPVIAHALARVSPPIKVEVAKAIEDDPTLAEPTYFDINEQFKRLIYNPVRTTASVGDKLYKVVVIDGVNECANTEVVASFIKLVLEWTSKIPLKIFITSRDEYQIRNAFGYAGDITQRYLHDIGKDVVTNDIRKYLETALARIKRDDSEEWPLSSELSDLVASSDGLFSYAATAVRYIGGGEDYKSRLSAMVMHGQKTTNKFEADVDSLYVQVLEKVCEADESDEVDHMRNLLSIIIFLRKSLPMEAIASLSQESNAHSYLSRLNSVILIPEQPGAVVAPFHASFPDFITNPDRCSPERCPLFRSLVASEGHQLIALKCLTLMNGSLKYNICEIPKEGTLSRRDRANSPEYIGKISEALKYSCIYWATHLAEVKEFDPVVIDALRAFLHMHILHWMECLSILSELQTGLKSLDSVVTVLSDFSDLQLLAYDACRCLKMNFEAVQKHCMEIYESALVWIPKNSLIRKTYIADVSRVPKVILGLSVSWGSAEQIMQNGSLVESVAFSQDGSQVICGSYDKTVRIWNVTTGVLEAELKGHAGSVNSVAFSQDGSRVVSGSDDKTVRIWNLKTGKVDAELKGHRYSVRSAAFSQDGSRIISGSDDQTVRIWNVTTGEVEAELMGHRYKVRAVAFSQDGSQVVSGSYDQTVRIWDVTTGKVEAELKGHTGSVNSVAFSQDGGRVISGSLDQTVRIWNVATGEVEAELKGHTYWVTSVAFWQNGSRVVFGSDDKMVRICNVTTGEVEAELKGHTSSVTSVAFSQDGSRVVSGSDDQTVQIWNVTGGEVEAELMGHRDKDSMVRIRNVTTGEVEAEMKGHAGSVNSVAFSQDGSRVVSGSDDKTVRIWNLTTGEVDAELKGHRYPVKSVAFSQDGSQVVSGSIDKTVRIWDVTKCNSQSILVTSGITLPDGSRVDRTDVGEFHIFYPSQEPTLNKTSSTQLSDDGHWIMANLFDCWIPSQYRNFCCFSIWGSQICLGYTSGLVVILDITAAL